MSFIAAAIIATATVGGALIARNGARSAAQAQENAANQANQTQWDMYNQNRTDAAPWREAGASVLPQLTSGLAEGGKYNRDFTIDDFQKDPGYEFRLSEGMKALERSRAARGGLYGGATGKALTRYGQDYASGEYTNAFNRYMAQRDAQFNRTAAVAGIGQTATQQVGNYGMNAANNISQNQIGAGNARASGYVGSANAINSGIGQGVNLWQRYMQQNGGTWAGGGSPTYTGYDSGGGPAYG